MKLDNHKKRENYYRRCQEIGDYIHNQTSANPRHVSDKELADKFGEPEYAAFLHEAYPLCRENSIAARNETIEWIWKSRHFDDLAMKERRARYSYILSWIAIVIAGISLIVSICRSLSLSAIQ